MIQVSPVAPSASVFPPLAQRGLVILAPSDMASPAALNAAIVANPNRTLTMPSGSYTWDMLADPNEVMLAGSVKLIALGPITVTVNNPTRGAFVLTDDYCSITGVNVIGAFGVAISGTERPNFNWLASDAGWIAWQAAWNTAHPAYVLPDPNTYDFKDAWNLAIPASAINLYFGEGGAQRNCAFYGLTGNWQSISHVHIYNMNCSVIYRGDATTPTGYQLGCACFFLDVEYVEFGLQYRQQRIFQWDEVTGRNGSHCQVQPQHIIYAGGDFASGAISTAICGRAHGDNWVVSQSFKFKEGHQFLSPPDLSADGGQTLLAVGNNASGALGLLLLTNQRITDPSISSQTFAAIEIIDGPNLQLLSGPKVYADTSQTDANLKMLYIESSPGVQVADGWVWSGAKAAGATDGTIEVNLNSDNVIIGKGQYTDTNNQPIRVCVVNNSNAARIGVIESTAKLIVNVIGTSTNTEVDVDSRLVVGWNESSSVSFPAGQGGVMNRLDGIITVNTFTAAQTLTARQSGQSFTNTGAVAQVVFTLPVLTSTPSNIGLRYSFSVNVAQNLQIHASGNDKIFNGAASTSAGGHADCATLGCSLTLLATDHDTWTVTSVTGTWTLA